MAKFAQITHLNLLTPPQSHVRVTGCEKSLPIQFSLGRRYRFCLLLVILFTKDSRTKKFKNLFIGEINMKKYLPSIFGVLLIFGGFGSLSKSLPGGLLILIAGLILLPAAKNLLVNRFSVAEKLNNKYINYGLVLALIMISAPVIDWSEKNKLIDEFNTNKSSIIIEIASNQDQKKFSEASSLIEKYLKVMPLNAELIGMRSQNETKKIEDEKLKAAVKLAEKEAAEKEAAEKIAIDAKKKSEDAATTNNLPKLSDGSKSDPNIVGKCIGYLAQVKQKGWPSPLSSRQQAYMDANNSAIQKIIKINTEQSNCIKPGQSLDGCLTGYSNNDSSLFQSFNTGIEVYNQAKSANDQVTNSLFSATCVE